MYTAVLIFFCTRWSLVAASTTHNVISSKQCNDLSGLLRSLLKGQQSVSHVRDFLSAQKISATEKACVGPTCEGYECCRCCCHGQCCTVQQWAEDLGIKASLSSSNSNNGHHTPNLCTCRNGTPASGTRYIIERGICQFCKVVT